MNRPGPLFRRYRAFSQLHENELLVSWARTPPGKWTVWAVAAILLSPFPTARLVIPLAALVLWLPERRRAILSLGAIATGCVALFERLGGAASDTAPAILAVAGAAVILSGLLYLCFLTASSFHRMPAVFSDRPQLWLHVAVWGVLAAFWLFPGTADSLPAMVFKLVAVSLPFVVWRCGYLLQAGKRGSPRDSRFVDHLFYLWPVWGGSNVPQGKGFDYLAQQEAGSDEAFARSRLAGVKLLVLAWLWKACERLLAAGCYGEPDGVFTPLLGGGHLGIPAAAAMMDPAAELALPLAWIGLYVELVRITLWLAGWGHVFVAALRLFGFNVFRNTYKPLLAETLLDFWNRFYYYFKELLVELFFFPVYLRWFKTRPRLRMFAAIYAAAFAGNVYYHVLSDPALLAGDWPRLFRMLESYTLYCFLLAFGVSASMVRQQQKRRAAAGAETSSRWARWRRIAGVWTFYSLIHIWDGHVDASLADRFHFFLSLFGL